MNWKAQTWCPFGERQGGNSPGGGSGQRGDYWAAGGSAQTSNSLLQVETYLDAGTLLAIAYLNSLLKYSLRSGGDGLDERCGSR
jgi:hypothetical protein